MTDVADLIATGVSEGLRNLPPDTTWRTGTVTAVLSGSLVRVRMDGDLAPIEVRVVVRPAINDRVLVVFSKNGGVWCLGSFGQEEGDAGTAWAVFTPWAIGNPPSWDWGPGGETYLRLNLVAGTTPANFSGPGSGGGGYGTDISTTKAGPVRITADLSGLSAGLNFWIISCAQVRAGAVVVKRDVVSGGSAGEWTTASMEHIFQAVAGDRFRISCNSGGAIWTLDPRSWITCELLSGTTGPQGPPGAQGPPGPAGPPGSGGGTAGGDEVWVGPGEPAVVDLLPELWVDTDEAAAEPPPAIPAGDTVGEVLTWTGPGPYDVEWMPPFDGTEIIIGPDPPTAADGSEGDYYLDETNGTLYGPKTEDGFWPPILGNFRLTVSDAVALVSAVVTDSGAVVVTATPLDAGGTITEAVAAVTLTVTDAVVGVVLT